MATIGITFGSNWRRTIAVPSNHSVLNREGRDCFVVSLLAMTFGIVFASLAKQSPSRNRMDTIPFPRPANVSDGAFLLRGKDLPLLKNLARRSPRAMFLMFNHSLTDLQEADARESLGVERFVALPDDLRNLWSNIPPENPTLGPLLTPFKSWLSSLARPGDFALIQGDFAACFLMVNYALEHRIVPVCSTTRREASETSAPDGTVILTHSFKHEIFRRYGS